MAPVEYKEFVSGRLSDEIINHSPEIHRISIGNCMACFTPSTRTLSFTTSSDIEWPMQSFDSFRRILDYIEIVYGSQ